MTKRFPNWVFGCLVVGLAQLDPASADSEQRLTIDCRFNSGLTAHYRVSPNRAAAQRLGVEPTRSARIEVAPAEYRLIFDEATGGYRVVVIIDRDTGNARRVYGPDHQMRRAYRAKRPGTRLVREVGSCQSARLRFESE